MDSHGGGELRAKEPERGRGAVRASGVRTARTLASPAPDDSVLLALQRQAGNAAVVQALEDGTRSPVLDVVGSAGTPLEPGLRTEMEARLGADLNDVRLHTDGAADRSARAVQASAYTVGSHVAFAAGVYDPASHAGKVTLAHELTHVLQQRRGTVDGTPVGGGISLSDPGDRFERAAEATAARVMAEPVPPEEERPA